MAHVAQMAQRRDLQRRRIGRPKSVSAELRLMRTEIRRVIRKWLGGLA